MEQVHAALFEPKDSPSKVCFGSEATVVGIAPYAQEDYYTPVLIVASLLETGIKSNALRV